MSLNDNKNKSERVKILHVAPSYYPAFKYGGPIESVYLLNKALVKKGISVNVITTNAGLKNRADIELNKWLNYDGVMVKYLPYYFYEHFTFSPQLFFSILKEIKNYSLVHITAFWNFPVFSASLTSLVFKKPFIISPRGVLYNEAISIKSELMKKIYFKLVANHYLNSATAIHFTSENEKDNVSDFFRFKNRSFIIPNGINLDLYRQLPDRNLFKKKHKILEGKKYILYLGRINKQKGIDILLKAFKEVAKLDKDMFLVIAGPDNDGYKLNIQNEIENLHLADRILFAGMLVGDEKIQAYAGAEIFILPSYFENFGMVVVEAMACNTPVIITNKVGIYKDVQAYNAGLVVEPKSENIYEGIKNLLLNPDLYNQVKTNAKKLIYEKYDIDIVANMMINAYKDVLI